MHYEMHKNLQHYQALTSVTVCLMEERLLTSRIPCENNLIYSPMLKLKAKDATRHIQSHNTE